MDQLERDKIVDEIKLSKLIGDRRQEAARLGDLASAVAEQLGEAVRGNGYNGRFLFQESGLKIEYWPESFRVVIESHGETVMTEADHEAINYHPVPSVASRIEELYKEARVLLDDKARRAVIEETLRKCQTWDIDPREVLR